MADAAEVPENAPRESATAGVSALMTLPAGTVVCFVDAAGPLAAVRVDKTRWVLRPVADLAASRGPGARRRQPEAMCSRARPLAASQQQACTPLNRSYSGYAAHATD
jgi:hypothetical protein